MEKDSGQKNSFLEKLFLAIIIVFFVFYCIFYLLSNLEIRFDFKVPLTQGENQADTQVMTNRVVYVSDATTSYNQEEDTISFYFCFLNKYFNVISHDAVAKIQIQGNNDEILYENTFQVKKEGFDYYTNSYGASELMYKIDIPRSDIEKSIDNRGSLIYQIYSFGEFDIKDTAYVNALPLLETKLNFPSCPFVIEEKNIWGEIDASYFISEISYEIKGSHLYVYFSGQRFNTTKESSYDSSIFNLNLVDKDGYIICQSILLLQNISKGSKFKNQACLFPDCITIGESYTLEIVELQ